MKSPMSSQAQEAENVFKNKSPQVVDALEHMFPGTRAAIKAGKCPVCSKPILKFKDLLSVKEYRLSGLCQQCQDEVFQ